ncbi:MAG: DUF1611 domain-containing protein [Pseudomonadota bacterium]
MTSGTLTQTLARAKWAFSTRRVDPGDAAGLSTRFEDAGAGDLVLGRVMSIGSHRRIQLTSGRPSILYPEDLVVLACGARYAPDQFEGIAKLDADGADMLAGGGCLGQMRQRNSEMKAPTRIEPVGLLTSTDGTIINLADYALAPCPGRSDIPVIGVVGASMNAGKTTATAALVYGLRQAGWRVAAIKATGTGAFGDYNAYADAGAEYVGDFTDTGMVSTYLEPLSRIIPSMDRLVREGAEHGCDIAVVELADGVFQRETAAMLERLDVQERFAGFVFACGDALAATGGVSVLRNLGIEPAVLTGKVSCSPMATGEAEAATGIDIVTKACLSDPAVANSLVHSMASGARLRPAA